MLFLEKAHLAADREKTVLKTRETTPPPDQLLTLCHQELLCASVSSSVKLPSPSSCSEDEMSEWRANI